MSDKIILQAFCSFRKIEWNSVVKGQKIFYHLKKTKKPEEAHGPFVIVETGVQSFIGETPVSNTIRFKNKQNFEFTLSEAAVQLLEFIEVV